MNNLERKSWPDNKIVYFSRFQKNPSGNGGDRRTAQICEILDHFEYIFVSMRDTSFTVPQKVKDVLRTPSGCLRKKIFQLFKQHVTYWKFNKWSDRFRDQIVYFHLMSKLFLRNLQGHVPKLLLIDDPVFLAPVVFYAKSKGIPLVAFCHNLETLSRGQVDPSYQREMFKYELDLVSMCDVVVTISREETFLLRNIGIDPVFIPYFPLKPTAERLQIVRKRRLNSIKSHFLLLGTVYNLPTLEGMKRVLTIITQKDVLSGDKLVVAGYGTNQLLGYLNDTRIEVLGDLTDAELDNVLTETKGCVVYQESGSGSLTKIPELLTAGVPVIINSHAARSHHNLPGIFEFESFDEMPEKLQLASKCDNFPNILCPPDAVVLLDRILEIITN